MWSVGRLVTAGLKTVPNVVALLGLTALVGVYVVIVGPVGPRAAPSNVTQRPPSTTGSGFTTTTLLGSTTTSGTTNSSGLTTITSTTQPTTPSSAGRGTAPPTTVTLPAPTLPRTTLPATITLPTITLPTITLPKPTLSLCVRPGQTTASTNAHYGGPSATLHRVDSHDICTPR